MQHRLHREPVEHLAASGDEKALAVDEHVAVELADPGDSVVGVVVDEEALGVDRVAGVRVADLEVEVLTAGAPDLVLVAEERRR